MYKRMHKRCLISLNYKHSEIQIKYTVSYINYSTAEHDMKHPNKYLFYRSHTYITYYKTVNSKWIYQRMKYYAFEYKNII